MCGLPPLARPPCEIRSGIRRRMGKRGAIVIEHADRLRLRLLPLQVTKFAMKIIRCRDVRAVFAGGRVTEDGKRALQEAVPGIRIQ